MKLIVGLGNKGSKYDSTRHNVGFMFIDFFLKKRNANTKLEKKFDAEVERLNIDGEDVIFAKPQSFMNLSGKAVQMIAKFYNIKNEDILVIYDDIDQGFNNVKCKKNGSHGGHNGMRHIIQLMGTSEISRLKIGIGRHNHMPVDKWVLSRFSKEEISSLNGTFSNYESFLENFVKLGFEKACNAK